MEPFVSLIEEANRAFKTADHLAYVTYPIVTEKKLLMIIVGHIHRAIARGFEALLTYEYLYKRVNYIPKEFEEQLAALSEIAFRYHIRRETMQIASEINEIIRHREKSPIEFVRKDRFIIASENFKLKMITIEKVKNYIQNIKYLFDRLNEVRALHDRRSSGNSQRRVKESRS